MTIPVFGAGQDLPFLSWRVAKHASSVFDGATTNAHGSLGEKPIYTIFTVTGVVAIQALFARVNTTVDDAGGASRLNLGVTGDDNFFDNTIVADTLLDTGFWGVFDLSGGTGAFTANISRVFLEGEIVVIDGADILETTTGADVTSGQLDYYMIWAALSDGATITGSGALS